MITPWHNHDDGWIALVNVNLENLPETIDVMGYKLQRKSEFHISLVSTEDIATLLHVDQSSLSINIQLLFVEFTEQYQLNQFKRVDTYYLIKKEDRVSLVQMVTMLHLNEFFDLLRNKIDTRIPDQPAHITIYTLQPDNGIGISSLDELHTLLANLHRIYNFKLLPY